MGKKKNNCDKKKYLKRRKEMLIEMRDLVYKRSTINKNIRILKTEMDGWDRALMVD